ncbi:hypothetical protein CASFOL_003358 [Castilleja foliolosa]|uniref:Uncharacterized protein n=1 Tax=Castilleja foliolosa TaxID=1961234 RepID=A0ABD3EIV0_9LAMI
MASQVVQDPLTSDVGYLTLPLTSRPWLCSENYNCKSEAGRGSARGHRLRLSLFGLAGITSAGAPIINLGLL